MKQQKWILDPSHSEISFKVKHLMISTVTGRFKDFSLELTTTDDDFSSVHSVSLKIDSSSIDTNNEYRDQHLRSADFFNSEVYPSILFESISYQGDKTQGTLAGNLTIRGVSRLVFVEVEFGGTVIDTNGQTKAGFSVKASINRKDFGLKWNEVTELGQVIVGDEVKLHGDIQVIEVQ
jgi:polyisoprenoid-binding protein YceI